MKNFIPYERIKQAKDVLRAISNDTRKEIINLIHLKGSMNVTELYVKLNMEQSFTSQHLAILRRANIVRTERKGKVILYSINYEKIQQVDEGVRKILGVI
jgi:DNA-binding transcriptional ArsR family regulator